MDRCFQILRAFCSVILTANDTSTLSHGIARATVKPKQLSKTTNSTNGRAIPRVTTAIRIKLGTAMENHQVVGHFGPYGSVRAPQAGISSIGSAIATNRSDAWPALRSSASLKFDARRLSKSRLISFGTRRPLVAIRKRRAEGCTSKTFLKGHKAASIGGGRASASHVLVQVSCGSYSTCDPIPWWSLE